MDRHQRVGSFLQWGWFEFRAAVLRARRHWQNWRHAASISNATLARPDPNTHRLVLGESLSPLWTASIPAESLLVAGKVQNLRTATARLNGQVIAGGETFSFWKIVGPPSRGRGFVQGRELREGCMVATVGGGLCQLSNALHLAALGAGMEILERHAHTRVIPGSIAASGRDATVFWNYKDLRFRHSSSFVIEARLDSTHLIVRLLGVAGTKTQSGPEIAPRVVTPADDCLVCSHEECVYHLSDSRTRERTALLLDEYWPEFDAWLNTQPLREDDLAFLPVDGVRHQRKAYASFQHSRTLPAKHEHRWLALRRSLAVRRLRANPAARQAALLRFDSLLAQAYTSRLPHVCRDLILSVNLLPHLAQTHVLGGRRVTVFLNRAPLFLLHQQLDHAASLYPDSPTIADFRAPSSMVERERAALFDCDRLLTPHVWIANELRRCGYTQVQVLPWDKVPSPPQRSGPAILFPASGLARKGAYEVRDVCRDLNLPVVVLGQSKEHGTFWAGCRVSRAEKLPALFRNIACVVLPAHVEHQPRILLAALANGIPVICSPNCGLPPDTKNVIFIEAGDAAALQRCLASSRLALAKCDP